MSIKLEEMLRHKKDRKLYKEDESLVSNIDNIGIEVEIENVNYNFSSESPKDVEANRFYNKTSLDDIDLAMWNVVKDGSLRNGSEFIFREPYKGASITAALDSMQSFLSTFRNNGGVPIASDRCSIHVHLDVRDLDNKEISNLVLNYMLVERVLFEYINPLRIKNNYCRPLTDSSFKYVINGLMLDRDEGRVWDYFLRDISNKCDKYSALNLLPITRFGSIEFRHHHGTTDMSKVKDWVNIILALKTSSRTLSSTDLIEIYNKDGAKVLIKSVLLGSKLCEDEVLDSIQSLDLLVIKGITDTKEVLAIDKLRGIIKSKKTSRVKEENTLLYAYKSANSLLTSTEDNSPIPSSQLALGV